MSDYKHLDQYEDHFEKERKHMDRGFDHPITNDPLSAVERSIEHPITPLPPTRTPAPKKPRLMPDPGIPHDPARLGYCGAHPPSNLPDPWRPGRSTYERSPFISRPRLGKADIGPRSSGKSVGTKTQTRKAKSDLVMCPKTNTAVDISKCKICLYYDPKDILHHKCRLKAIEANRLAGKAKKGGKK